MYLSIVYYGVIAKNRDGAQIHHLKEVGFRCGTARLDAIQEVVFHWRPSPENVYYSY